VSQVHESPINQGFLSAREQTSEAQELAASSFDALPSLSQIFAFSGRVGRATYTLVQIFLILTVIMVAATFEAILSHGLQDLLTIATPLVHGHAHPDLVNFFDRIGGGDPLRVIVGAVCLVTWYIIGLSVTVRRFHDFGYSGWSIIPLNLAGMIPYVGWIVVVVPFAVSGEEGANQYGDPPKPTQFLARVRQVPRHLWRGETPLPNMLFIYVLFLDFLVLDKAGTTLMAGLDVSIVNLLFVGAIIILNCVLAVGLWRSATISDKSATWRFFGKLVAVVLVTRVVCTLASLLVSGSI
jgi:uncharacterized membrane protein YhaH (DUF805 family)